MASVEIGELTPEEREAEFYRAWRELNRRAEMYRQVGHPDALTVKAAADRAYASWRKYGSQIDRSEILKAILVDLARWPLDVLENLRKLPEKLPDADDLKVIIIGLAVLGALFYFGPALSALATRRQRRL